MLAPKLASVGASGVAAHQQSVNYFHCNPCQIPQRCRRLHAHSATTTLAHRTDDSETNRQRVESGQNASTSEGDVFPLDVEDTPEMAVVRRKSQVLMDILTSGDKVEEVIAQHTEEIDKQLIQMLSERIRAGMRMRERKEVLGGMTLVKRRLQAVLAAREASPAQRLLNDMVGLMSFSEGVDQADQEEEVERHLRTAFLPPKMPHVDIFEVTARLARGEEVEPFVPDQDSFVPQHVFVRETEQLLLESARNVRDMGRALERQNYGKYEAAYRYAYDVRSEALNQVRIILKIAKNI